MGHLLEPIAAHWYAKKTGNRVYEDTNLYQHADHLYALANFDRRFERASDGEPGILECKSCTYHKASEWDDGAIPLYYELQLRFYLAVADVNIGSFSAIWGNNPDNDLAIPDITRDKAKEDMIFERLDEWIWSLEHDKPPTMSGVAPQLALESLARIYGESQSGLPTIEFSSKQENALRRIALLQGKITECNREIKTYEKEIEAHSVRIAEIMKEHEHGVLTTTSDKLLIDYVTKSTTRPDSKVLKAKYPTILPDVMKTTQSRKVKVSMQELNYRICVLETFESLCKSAPVTMDTKAMGFHFQLVDAYVRFTLNERKFGPKTDAEGQKKRETALQSFTQVVQDGRKRFSSFNASTQEQYKTCINNYIKTILPVWMQYRNTYINF